MRTQRLIALIVTLAATCLAAGAQASSASQGPHRIIETARAVHSLPPEKAAHEYPVRLHAVVSYYDPYIDPRRGALFVQDASGGVFVSLPARPILAIKPGDLVAITGVTGPGDYAAIVTAAQVLPVGQSRLPARPLKTTLMQLLTGAFDCQWVEVEGRVRSAHLGPGNVVLGVAANGGSLTAVTVRQPGVDYEALVDSLVRIDGVAAPVFNQRRQMVGVRVFFPTLRQTNVIQPAPRDPFTAPTVSISDLFRNSAVHGLLHRVHVRGTVTLDWPGLMLCIQDGNSGICMQTAQAASVPVGSFVDVVGFPAINLFKPTLEDAVFRTAVGPAAPASLVPITADQAITGDLDGRLVQIDAELIGRNLAAADPTLMLRAGRLIFPVILPRHATLGAVTWKDGSVLRITGVCNTQIDSLNSNLLGGPVRLQSVHVLLRSIDDISLLQAPSWWTSQHALESFAVVGLVVLAAFAWIIILRYRVKLQTRALRASEDRLRHLSEHDALTGLPNRILLNDRLQTALKRAERFQTCLGVLLVDVDGFKEVNDALGHQAGDTLLCHLAARFNNCVRATDTVGRLGGDEFVVLLPDLLFPAEAANIAAKIVSAVSDPLTIDRTLVVITASIGVVTYPEGSASPEALMQCADEAMYAAKEKGKNGFQVYRPKPAASAGEGGSVLGPAPRFALPTGRA
jgi:diguanylate cyclase (GGDEF)-like protein